MRQFTWILILLLAVAGVCRAQEGAAKTTASKVKKAQAKAKPKFLPIDIQTFGWGRNATNGYYYNGLQIQSLPQFEAVIDPLGDAQASQMIRSSANKDLWGQVFLWTGGAAVLVGSADLVIQGINLSTTNDTGAGGELPSFNLGQGLIPLGAGIVGLVAGFLLEADAGGDRYNAVNRYNYVTQQNKSLSFMLLPDTNQPGFVFTQRF